MVIIKEKIKARAKRILFYIYMTRQASKMKKIQVKQTIASYIMLNSANKLFWYGSKSVK